ncbi:hypothetical protein HGM15179_009188 [Zosterops borbonicus]|uniref:Ig-like domain-containing protein n=1 Tax=Zosterops borbonicus TaxID=364589 RepID=A0A8K1GH20_9PASS|nr:hypothetical protein HGM15179_009188 [Zosterops borbonicus]
MDHIAEGIPDFQYVFTHWYQHVPPKLHNRFCTSDPAQFPTMIVSVATSILLQGKVQTFTINDINSNDEGTYYCAYWHFHGTSADMQSAPVQSPELQKQMIGTSASLSCRLKEKSEIYLHWYKQLPGERPKRILYQTGGTPVFDDSSDRNRFEVRNDPTQSVYGLTINSLTVRDSGIYYYGFAQQNPVQSPISITKFQKSARMTCEIQTGENFDSIVIHWYKQKEGKAPERLLFVSGDKTTTDTGRYIVERKRVQKQCVLTIKDVIPDDAATYYCALFTVIGYYNKVFGSGTKLIVSEKGSSPPANSEILQKKHENQITYVCLIEKFYPDIIRVTWNDDEKEITDQVVKGDTWQSTKEDEYSIASWLTVPAENEDKKYYCKYEHEEKKDSLSTQVDSVKTAPQEEEEDCKTGFNTDQLMHRTAYLVYIILLLKSSMYYLIVLFFIYRVWASTKYQGKKI